MSQSVDLLDSDKGKTKDIINSSKLIYSSEFNKIINKTGSERLNAKSPNKETMPLRSDQVSPEFEKIIQELINNPEQIQLCIEMIRTIINKSVSEIIVLSLESKREQGLIHLI